MALSVNFDGNSVPNEYQSRVDRLRDFLDDTIAQNDLEGIEESTDLELYFALEDTWDEINFSFDPPDLNFDTISAIPWGLLKMGAVLNVLTSKGLGSARNTLTYNDAGGITIKDQDKFGRYTVWFNTLLSEYRRRVAGWKRSQNISGGYGGSHSEYYDNWY